MTREEMSERLTTIATCWKRSDVIEMQLNEANSKDQKEKLKHQRKQNQEEMETVAIDLLTQFLFDIHRIAERAERE